MITFPVRRWRREDERKKGRKVLTGKTGEM